jgi:hypothetical protein
MAKSRNNKKKKSAQPPAQQTMSPKNYILTGRARKLPIGTCWISTDIGNGLQTVVVARTHVTGNVTMAVYLVDTLCLGVKNTMYYFNMPVLEYNQFLKRIFAPHAGCKAADYAYIHNLVYGAAAYAASLGFQPNKDWDVAQFVLEPQSAVPQMALEFGRDGRPVYVSGPYDNVNKIINTLNRTVGEDGYEFVARMGNDFDPSAFDFYDEDDDEEYEDDDDVEDVEHEEIKP